MPTVLQINSVANWGSTGRIAEGIGEAAISCGWESYIAFGRGNPVSKSHLIRVGNKWNMLVHWLMTRIFDLHGLASRRATKNLVRKINEIKPDIIHLHNIHGYYLNYGILFRCLSTADIPVVWTLHDCWTFTGHCCYFDFAGCGKWQTSCHNCPQLRTYPVSFGIIDRAASNYLLKKHHFNQPADVTLIPVSDWLAGIVSRSFLGKRKVHRIYNGVDLQQFRPMPSESEELKRKLGIRTPHFILGVASSWTRRKGLEDFIELRNLLSVKEYTIVLLGLSGKQMGKLSNGIIGLQRTDSIEELVQLYSAADVYVNPTWEDNFPTTNIEALACGTPVVTYRTGGSVEAVDDCTGLIVEQGSVPALAEAIKRFASLADKESIRQVCRQRAEKLYDKNERFTEYVKLYDSLLGKRNVNNPVGGGKNELIVLYIAYCAVLLSERRDGRRAAA